MLMLLAKCGAQRERSTGKRLPKGQARRETFWPFVKRGIKVRYPPSCENPWLSGRGPTQAFLRHPPQSRRKRTKIPRTLALQVCDHCIQEEATDRSAHSLLGAMLLSGQLPSLLLCPHAQLSRRRCDIASRARPQASLPAEEPALRCSARSRRWCFFCRQARDQQKCSSPTRSRGKSRARLGERVRPNRPIHY